MIFFVHHAAAHLRPDAFVGTLQEPLATDTPAGRGCITAAGCSRFIARGWTRGGANDILRVHLTRRSCTEYTRGRMSDSAWFSAIREHGIYHLPNALATIDIPYYQPYILDLLLNHTLHSHYGIVSTKIHTLSYSYTVEHQFPVT